GLTIGNNWAMNEHRIGPGGPLLPVDVDDGPGESIAAFCPLYHRAVELIGRRWTGAILRALLCGAIRFSDITAAIPGLSDRLLSERLKELETAGIVSRTVIPATPVRIEYRLTEKGHALNEAMAAIAAWAETWLRPDVPPATVESTVEPRQAGVD
ncbi:MAG: winged helix-turn-helix transcriptional regulator, partial [Geminicoccales bacterium]